MISSMQYGTSPHLRNHTHGRQPIYMSLGKSSPIISAKPVGVGAASQQWILAGTRSGLLTHIAAQESYTRLI
jgi:hypothetical protein